jgi:hypothetical protein
VFDQRKGTRSLHDGRCSIFITFILVHIFGALNLNYGSNGDCFNVGYSGWAAEYTDISGKRRFQPGLSLLAFETLDESSFLSADVGACTAMHEDVKVKSRTARIFANQTSLICLEKII